MRRQKWYISLALMVLAVLALSVPGVYAEDGADDYAQQMNLGEFFEMEGDYYTALEHYKKAAEMDGAAEEAFLGVANILYYTDQTQELIQWTTKVIGQFPESSEARVLRALGFYESDALELAKKEVLLALDKNPENDHAMRVMSDILIAQGEYDLAESYLFAALQYHLDDGLVYADLGWLYLDMGSLDQSLEYFHKSAEISPDSYSAFIGMGQAYAVVGEFHMAAESFEKAAEIHSSVEVHHYRGLLYLEADDLDQALLAFEQALGIDPKNLDTYLLVAEALLDAEYYDEAMDYLARAVKVDETFSPVWNDIGLVHLREERFPQALEAFTKASELDPENGLVLANIGTTYYQMGDKVKALEAFAQSLEIDPSEDYTLQTLRFFTESTDDLTDLEGLVQHLEEKQAISDELYRYIGFTYLDHDDKAMGELYIRLSLGEAVNDIDVQNVMGDYYFFNDRYDESAEHYLLSAMKNDVYAIEKMALVSAIQTKYESAVQWFKMKESFAALSSWEYQVLAECYSNLNYVDETIGANKMAIKLDPQNAQATYQLAFAYHYMLRDYDSAKKYYKMYLETNPMDQYAISNYARLHYSLKDYDRAMLLAQKALELDPDDDWVMTLMGDIFVKMNKPQDAIDMYEQAYMINPESVLNWVSVAHLFGLTGDFETAFGIIEEQLNDNPYSYHLFLEYAKLLAMKGEYEDMIEVLNVALALKPNHIQRGWIETDEDFVKHARRAEFKELLDVHFAE